MRYEIVDGHMHFHYGSDASDEQIKEGLNEFQDLRKKYDVRKVAGIFRPENAEVVKGLEDSSIYPGVYISGFDDLCQLKHCYESFEFVKIHHSFLSPDFLIDDYLKPVIDESIALGFKKFQIHTENIQKPFIELIKGYIEKDSDMFFYLVHGVDSIYGSWLFTDRDMQIQTSRPKILEEILALENNILLGTFPSSPLLTYPNQGLQSAIEDGLKEIISFDSDFTLDFMRVNPGFYGSCIENVTKSVGCNTKILKTNSRHFFR